MVHRACVRLADKAIANNVIGKDDGELYVYAYEMAFWFVVGTLTTCLIGALLRCFKEAVLFQALMLPLRIYAGGFHLSSYFKCYIATTALNTAILIVCTNGEAWVAFPALVAVYLLTMAMVVWKSPISDPNKPLDETQMVKYHRHTVYIASFEVVLFAVLALLGVQMRVLLFVAAAPLVVAALMLPSIVTGKANQAKTADALD